jgi:hypothetical protein
MYQADAPRPCLLVDFETRHSCFSTLFLFVLPLGLPSKSSNTTNDSNYADDDQIEGDNVIDNLGPNKDNDPGY